MGINARSNFSNSLEKVGKMTGLKVSLVYSLSFLLGVLHQCENQMNFIDEFIIPRKREGEESFFATIGDG